MIIDLIITGSSLVLAIVLLILILKTTYSSHFGRILVMIGAIICFKSKENILEKIYSMPNNHLSDLFKWTSDVFLFLFPIVGLLYVFIEVVLFISNKVELKKLSNTAKWILTIIFFILAIACFGTVILTPLAFAFRDAIKALWKKDNS